LHAAFFLFLTEYIFSFLIGEKFIFHNRRIYSMNIISMGKKGKVAVITLNRPERLNAFNRDMFYALAEITEQLKQNLPRAIVITGGEKDFSAGFDVNPDNPLVGDLIEAVKNHKREPVDKLISLIRKTTDDFTGLPVPVIAAISGKAYGGGAELAARCDIRIADPESRFCFSETKLGLMPDWGGGVALTRLAGTGISAELILTARTFDSEEALRIGFINRISKPGGSLNEALSMAETIAKNGPAAVRACLRVIRAGTGIPLNEALDLESDEAAELITTGECFHGISAFLSKKEPEFPDI